MVVLISLILSIFPFILIIFPLIRKYSVSEFIPQDESSLFSDLERRWDSAIEGLRSTELERMVGNLHDQDYEWLKNIHLYEAALVLKALDLSEIEQNQLIDEVRNEVFRSVLITQDKLYLKAKE
ncbi:MAG: hypothetical protein CL750_03630 [Chloroflexi bacterium]|nr:hypothetical protein [Chloroflexota bacterium]|tara:strand:+ start:4299 stop:4670 length:372 start_codon:yes stop_codon:yes gene_type:complete